MQIRNISAFTEACLYLQFNSSRTKEKMEPVTALRLNIMGSWGSLMAMTIIRVNSWI